MNKNTIQILAAIAGVGLLVFGSLQLATIPMPSPETLCGQWG